MKTGFMIPRGTFDILKVHGSKIRVQVLSNAILLEGVINESYIGGQHYTNQGHNLRFRTYHIHS